MTKYLTIEDFIRKEVGQGVFYFSADVGKYEITLEPHLTAGYTIGIYDHRDPLLSIKKRAVWKFNHPDNPTRERIERELIDRALEVAQYFYEYYELKNKDAELPHY